MKWPRRSALLAIGALALHSCQQPSARSERPPAERTLVSLSPGITQSVIALGAEARLLGVSDYCQLPPHLTLPRLGSAITPNYEAIARLEPDLIVATEVAGTQLEPLGRLARPVSLPWLELHEVEASLRRLGKWLGREEAGDDLAERLHAALTVPPPADALRVLWILDLGDGGGSDTWFVRDNSLHGAVLRAAGAHNAIPKAVAGPPKISAEQLLEIDPDLILLVLSAPNLDAGELSRTQAQLKARFARWAPLSAVQTDRLLAVHHPDAMNLGPGVLDLIPVLSRALARSGARSEEAPRSLAP